MNSAPSAASPLHTAEQFLFKHASSTIEPSVSTCRGVMPKRDVTADRQQLHQQGLNFSFASWHCLLSRGLCVVFAAHDLVRCHLCSLLYVRVCVYLSAPSCALSQAHSCCVRDVVPCCCELQCMLVLSIRVCSELVSCIQPLL